MATQQLTETKPTATKEEVKAVSEAIKAVVKPRYLAESYKMSPAEHARQEFALDVPTFMTPAELEDPEFYSSISNKLKPFYKIEVRAEDMSFYAEVLVLYAVQNAARVKVLNHTKISAEIITDNRLNEYSISYVGLNKWCIFRKSDNVLIAKGINTDADAYAELNKYLKSLGK